MSEDLQSLLEKINRDGVEKAQSRSAAIIAEAEAKAKSIIESAKAEAEKSVAEAEKREADYAARAAETIRQSARDTILKVKGAVEGLLVNLLAGSVDKALADPATAAKLAGQAITEAVGGAEIACGSKLAAALKAQLKAAKNLKVVLDENLGTGFTVRVEGGRVEHSFTGEAITGELVKRLRPDLAALLK